MRPFFYKGAYLIVASVLAMSFQNCSKFNSASTDFKSQTDQNSDLGLNINGSEDLPDVPLPSAIVTMPDRAVASKRNPRDSNPSCSLRAKIDVAPGRSVCFQISSGIGHGNTNGNYIYLWRSVGAGESLSFTYEEQLIKTDENGNEIGNYCDGTTVPGSLKSHTFACLRSDTEGTNPVFPTSTVFLPDSIESPDGGDCSVSADVFAASDRSVCFTLSGEPSGFGQGNSQLLNGSIPAGESRFVFYHEQEIRINEVTGLPEGNFCDGKIVPNSSFIKSISCNRPPQPIEEPIPTLVGSVLAVPAGANSCAIDAFVSGPSAGRSICITVDGNLKSGFGPLPTAQRANGTIPVNGTANVHIEEQEIRLNDLGQQVGNFCDGRPVAGSQVSVALKCNDF